MKKDQIREEMVFVFCVGFKESEAEASEPAEAALRCGSAEAALRSLGSCAKSGTKTALRCRSTESAKAALRCSITTIPTSIFTSPARLTSIAFTFATGLTFGIFVSDFRFFVRNYGVRSTKTDLRSRTNSGGTT